MKKTSEIGNHPMRELDRKTHDFLQCVAFFTSEARAHFKIEKT